MTCSLFDLGCKLHEFVAPFWTFLVWGFWIVVSLVALSALYKIHSVFGWYGIIGVVSLGLGFYLRDRLSQHNPNEVEDTTDFRRSPTVHKKRPPAKKGHERWYNPDTNTWELR